ncbi:unnamed protein product [Candida parapsilosis]
MHVGVNLGIQRQYVPVTTLKQKSYPLLPIEDASFLNFHCQSTTHSYNYCHDITTPSQYQLQVPWSLQENLTYIYNHLI